MTIETALYISELNTAYPESNTSRRDGDNHLRLLKTTLKASFPKDLRHVSSPAKYQRLLYDGTDCFKNFSEANYPLYRGTLASTTNLNVSGTGAYTEIVFTDSRNTMDLTTSAGSQFTFPETYSLADVWVNLHINVDMTRVTSSLLLAQTVLRYGNTPATDALYQAETAYTVSQTKWLTAYFPSVDVKGMTDSRLRIYTRVTATGSLNASDVQAASGSGIVMRVIN